MYKGKTEGTQGKTILLKNHLSRKYGAAYFLASIHLFNPFGCLCNNNFIKIRFTYL